MSIINKEEYLHVEPIIKCDYLDQNLDFDNNLILIKSKIPIKLKIVKEERFIQPKIPLKLKIEEEGKSIKPKISIKLRIKEEWRPIIGYESSYEVSNFGNIKSLLINKIMKKTKNTDGYEYVKLQDINKKRRGFPVHRLVALNFILNPDNKPIVDHIDNNHSNNTINNLRWVTHKENSEYYHRIQKKTIHIKVIYQYDLTNKLIAKWDNYKELLNQNVTYSQSYIMQTICEGKTCYGYIWKYEDKIEYPEETFINVGTLDNRDFSNYEISNNGKVKSLIYNKILKPAKCKGYERVSLLNKVDKKYYGCYVHILVASIFVNGKNEDKKIVNHLDENKLNNCYTNLEWVTHQENIKHSAAIKIDQIDQLTGQILMTFNSIVDAAKHINGDRPNIIACCKGRRPTAYGYKWKYHD